MLCHFVLTLFKTKQHYNTFTVPCEKFKLLYSDSTIMKKIDAVSPLSNKINSLYCFLDQHQVVAVYLNLL